MFQESTLPHWSRSLTILFQILITIIKLIKFIVTVLDLFSLIKFITSERNKAHFSIIIIIIQFLTCTVVGLLPYILPFKFEKSDLFKVLGKRRHTHLLLIRDNPKKSFFFPTNCSTTTINLLSLEIVPRAHYLSASQPASQPVSQPASQPTN